MNPPAKYAYVQSRLYARQGMRPDETVWRQLQAQTDLSVYLLSARKTVLRPWVLALHAGDPAHVMESALLNQYKYYVEQLARWIPVWRDAVLWVCVLTEIPSVQFLLDGRTAPQWMLNQSDLQAAGSVTMDKRIEALSHLPFRPLLEGWQGGMTLTQAWLYHWYDLMPQLDSRSNEGVQAFVNVLQEHKEHFAQSDPAQAGSVREALFKQLTHMFHRYTFQPVALFIHLALVAADLERLRGDIVSRSLFAHIKEHL
ncbi:MAG: hypothetical protein OEZ68_07820 [Gammaproteobacteria bacterium]|nr:hypothetical protein [Gammaproteobacteria bacterium]MDH5800693.1 hypothetical protein [Gammaproteobacteria bacterium]